MPDNLDEIIRVRVTKDLKDSLQRIADTDARDLAQLARKILVDYVRAHRTAGLTLNEKPAIKYPVRKRGIAKEKEN